MNEAFDIVVIGGGPAGSVASLRLVELGFKVGLVGKANTQAHHVGESLPPSIVPLLDSIGVVDALDQAKTLRTSHSIVKWADSEGGSSLAAAPGAIQVDRGRFDRLLLDHSARAGVNVIRSAEVTDAKFASGQWRLKIESNGARFTWHSNFVVDATGTRSLLRRGRYEYKMSPTFAISGHWRCVPADRSSSLEAGDDCWYWSAPVPDNCVSAVVFVDPTRFDGTGARKVDELYRELLSASELLRHFLDGKQASPVRVCDVTPRSRTISVASNWCKVGEAAFSFDPISSQGTQAAIASSLRAAPVINTLLRKPERTQLAADFYHDRQATAMSDHLATASEIYNRQYQLSGAPFWKARAGRSLRRASEAPIEFSFRLDDWIERAAGSHLTSTGVVRNEFIEAATAVVQDDTQTRTPGTPIAFLGRMELSLLLSPLESPRRVHDVLNDWSRQYSPEECLNALSILARNQFITKSAHSGN